MKSNVVLFALFVSVVMMVVPAAGYKPIVCLHGFTCSYTIFDDFIKELKAYSPGHDVFALNVDNAFQSWKKMQTLVDDTAAVLDKVIAENKELFKDGFIFYAHSQGGLVARALLQQRRYNVTKFISAAGIQNGFYGDCETFIIGNKTCEAVTKWMYSDKMQDNFSVAGYWRSPDRDEFLQGNKFLTILNNEEGVTTTPEYQKMQKDNFLSIGQMYFFGSQDDEMAKPWFTSLFETYRPDGTTVIPRDDQYIYQHDTFGLYTATQQGRAHFTQVDGVKHEGWVRSQMDIVRKYIFPLFD